jgi:hypothetical protein
MTAQLELFTPAQLTPAGPAYERERYWGIAICHPGGWGRDTDEPTDTCRPTLLSLDMRCNCWNRRGEERCQCVGYYLFRGSCRGCSWYGPARTSEDAAVYDTHDHCYPGWRELPVIIGPIPETGSGKKGTSIDSFIARLESIGYPPGWIQAGGPIRERRQQGGTRAHTVHTGYGNYTICGEVVGCCLSIGMNSCEGLDRCLTGRCTPYEFPDQEIE